MYELFTLDFFKNHFSRATTAGCNIVLGSYDDVSFYAIKNAEEAEKILTVSQANIFRIANSANSDNKFDCPSNMLVLYSLERKSRKKAANDKQIWEEGVCSENDFIGVALLSCYDLKAKEIEKKSMKFINVLANVEWSVPALERLEYISIA